MYCLEVYVNDKKVALVGRENSQNYHATVTYWGERDFVEVSASGVSDINANRVSETFSWGNQELNSGDIVTIKVIDCESPDNPIEVEEHDHSEDMEEFDNLLADMIAKYRVKAELEGSDFLNEKESTDRIYCSFCGKEKAEVVKMVGGPSVKICNECVDTCNQIIDGKTQPPKWPRSD